LSDGWSPSAEVLTTSRAAALVAAAGAAHFDKLLQRSIEDPAWYWDFAVDPGDLASLDDATALDAVRRALDADRESSRS
jgi:hypothetical protein